MWRNTEVLRFTDWLRGFNDALAPHERVGFYGLDLYSLFSSIEQVLGYLDQVDPAAAGEARQRYACFDQSDADSQAYGDAAGLGLSDSCHSAVVAQLQQLQQRAAHYTGRAGPCAEDALFHAQQNARLVINAEEYYRTMCRARVAAALRERRLERAIGVLYRPETERQSHYFHASLPAQFDAIIHIDRTCAVVALETVGRPGKEQPETVPVGV